jgi:mono/diheme cytochrome c family protein
MTKKRYLAGAAAIVVAGLASFSALAWRSELAPVEIPATASFDLALVGQGASLAAIGNCNVCHTQQGGEMFAGGLALPTPFGTIYSTNITPDPDTGIGRWSEEAFTRAMREGVDREGHHLYPAFPYDHFTKVTDGDNKALYAFLMTRKPVHAETPANKLPFPLNVRMVLAGWKLLFFKPGEYQPDTAQSAEWNRGAYLAEGLGHCGACHTPRNSLGAEKKDEVFAGGEAEGWTAYALNAATPAPVPWTAESLTHYLTTGWEEHHGVARGPMAPVTANMKSASPEDAKAIATYVASIMGKPAPERQASSERALQQAGQHPPGLRAQVAGSQTVPVSYDAKDAGAAIYATACSSCHDAGRPVPYGGLPLHLSSAINGPTPMNPINVILYGLPAPEGERGPIMPGFAGTLTDEQVAQLLAYMRKTFSDKPEWKDPQALVADIRAGHKDTDLRSLSSGSNAPANPTKRETSW